MNAAVDIPNGWEELEQIVKHYELCRSGQADDITGALVIGWDAMRCPFSIDPPGDGVWRAAHPLVLHDITLAGTSMVAILHAGMNADQIEAGFWRQLRVLPDNAGWRRAALAGVGTKDPFTPPRRAEEIDGRRAIIRSLLGHTPADAAAYLVNKLRLDPRVGRLLLAKEFMRALKLAPDLWNDPWPEALLERWARQGHREKLSPLAFLIVLACLSRLAQNVSAHIMLSYNANGTPFYGANYRDDIPTLATGAACDATRRLVGRALLQSSALLAPTGSAAASRRWSTRAAALIGQKIAELKGDAFGILANPATPEDARFIGNGLLANPGIRPDQPVAMFRGWPVKPHAMLGALQIRTRVEAWNRDHQAKGRAGGGMNRSERQGRPFNFPKLPQRCSTFGSRPAIPWRWLRR